MLNKPKITSLRSLTKELRSQSKPLPPALERQTGGYRESQLTRVQIHRQKPQEPVLGSFYPVPHVWLAAGSHRIHQKTKHTSKRQNHTQLWQGCWDHRSAEFKTTVTNMPRAIIKQADTMEEQTGKVSREMEMLRRNQKETLKK